MENKIDSLTGLYDRQWMIDHLEKVREQGETLSVAIMDIDFFTNINEAIGRRNGDAALCKMAGCFCREENVEIGRYGSDEFIFSFCNWDKQAIIYYLKELKEKFIRTRFIHTFPYEKVKITFSMGVAWGNGESGTISRLLKSGEIALATAKKNGRNQIIFLEEENIKILKHGRICNTIAGMGLKGNSEDGEEAWSASIAEPYGVEVDVNGEILYVDRSNHQIKRIHHGKIYTVAGKGEAGFFGDGGAAVMAGLCKPSGVCVDSLGRIYIADTGNHRIRRIERGRISTVAGSGKCGYGGDGGKAVDSELNRPGGVAVDKNFNIYTNDYGNNVIRKIDSNGRISTVTGSGEFGYGGDMGNALCAALDKPYGLCLDQSGQYLFIADFGNHCIRETNLDTGMIRTICGTGKAGYSGDGGSCHKAALNGPYWVSCKGKDLYIADTDNHCIRKIDLKTQIISTAVGGIGPGYVDQDENIHSVRLCKPAGIAVDERYIYIADYGNNAVRCVTR